MNELEIFNYGSTQIRTTQIDYQPWFVLKDVCEVFGETNYRRVTGRLDDDEKGVSQIDTPGGIQSMTVVNEPGLYSVLFAMQPEKARGVSEDYIAQRQTQLKAFKRWITHDVIPAIRRTGSYSVKGAAISTADYLKAARIVSRCPNKRLPIVLSLLESSGIDVEAVVAAGRAMALMEPAKPERYPHRRVYTTEQKMALADEAIELLWVCGLNNKQMAEKLGIPYNMIAKYRNGYRRPEPDRAEHIIKTLKADMEIVEVEA